MNFIERQLENDGQNPRTFPKEALTFAVRYCVVSFLTMLPLLCLTGLSQKFAPVAPGAKPTTPQLVLILVPFCIWLFLAISVTLSLGGSWFWLARRYRAPRGYKPEYLLRWQSGMIGVWGASRILKVGTGTEGLYLAFFWPFAFMQPPLLIPWTQIVAARHRKVFLKHEALFLTVGEPKQATIRLTDKKSIQTVLPYVKPILNKSQTSN